MSEENSKPGLTFEALFDQLVQEKGNVGQTDTFPTGPDCQNDKRQAKSDDELLADGLSQVTLKEGETKLKIASWNMKDLDQAKATKQFIDAVCKIITRKKFDLLALQEIWDPIVIQMISKELNNGDDTQWSYVSSSKAGIGNEYHAEYFGFLYNKKSGIELTASALMAVKIKLDKYEVLVDVKEANKKAQAQAKVQAQVKVQAQAQAQVQVQEVHLAESILCSGTENFTRKPYLGLFKINEIEFSLITVHNKYSNTNTERTKNEAKTLVKLNQLVDFGKNVIILGDFNLSPTDEAIKGLKDEYESCITDKTNVNQDKEYDNIWIRKTMLDRFSKEESGVVTEDLEYKNADGHVTDISDHCPIYVTLSIKKISDSNDLA
ncbi:uncharacterized protein LOC131929832 isoform X2 [Physella acuta]|uniref:uncharacterized protein LOC131929832 isoform X2 n=1 Tax=Physella acuta TaxID=109671 RepID=UPI0027DC83FA|nr:uncharacterized protein LOC131929832 isoform X2 [Physella acuta]